MALSRKLGVFLVVIGGLLLGIYLVPTVYGTAMAHLALWQFRSENVAHRGWDSARIRAYQRTLSVSFAAPEAVLRVPKVGIEVPVLEGVSDLTLNRGVGHVPGTAMPGEVGNVAITGHRDGFFRGLKDVVPGDLIEVQRPERLGGSRTDHYVVRTTKVVFPSDTSVLNKTADSTLTLITCFPFYFVGSAPQRFIVQASLLSTTERAVQIN
ncbi:class D sortase [Granulicella arctica]|uniref:class D sortase n=1 Tax=Granulicella arctica TaxID=940613 RepID=UPI0021DFEA7C|nr:class D sortase [Granulicella arctica]